MRVTVKLHAILRDYRPPGFKGDLLHLDLEEGATVLHVLEHIGIPRKTLHAAFLNEEQVGVDAALNENDFLRLFPPVAGGSPVLTLPFLPALLYGRGRGVAKPGSA